MIRKHLGIVLSSLIVVSSLFTKPVYAAGSVTIPIKNEQNQAGENFREQKKLILKGLSLHMPGEMLQYFVEHHGVIYVGNWDGAGFTNLAVTEDNKPIIPDTVYKDYPLEMHISIADADAGLLDDYVLHEFGHVFDARYGITRTPQYNDIIAKEMPGVQAAMAGIALDPNHYMTTPEAFAQVYAAYSGGSDVAGSQAVLKAAPYTAGIIKAIEESGIR